MALPIRQFVGRTAAAMRSALADVAKALGIRIPAGASAEQVAVAVAKNIGLSGPSRRPLRAEAVLGQLGAFQATPASRRTPGGGLGTLAPLSKPGSRATPPASPQTRTQGGQPPPIPPRPSAAPSGRPQFPKTSKWSPWKALVPLEAGTDQEYPIYPETFTPQSSNVFSFTYSPQASILYVTFKAVRLHRDSTRVGRGRRGGERQLRGTPGRTVAGKSNSRGPMYAYLDVPERVYERMLRANSKGKFVWDELRVRGTIYGHQYQYNLVHGSPTAEHGLSNLYIPRKATRSGFKVRSVATVGQGRRGFKSSTLPSQIGFSTFRTRGAP